MSDVLTPGQVFAGRYRIERFLAKGGFGAVYVAEQIETELRVAIKVLWPHVLHSEEAVEKFKLEARIAGRVGSDYIVKVFDAGFDDTTRMPFLVMELLQGGALEDIVEKNGPLSPDQLVVYFRQIASALDKAHGYVDREGAKAPIVHRDLKPENLFLTHRETGEAVVKILDFGIAKVLGDSAKVSQEVKGTPLYMAYEQAAGGRITPQTDIWALGLIAYFLLSGRPYWKSASLPDASVTQLFGEVLSLPIEPPSRRMAASSAPVVLPEAFDAWFLRCVDRDASRRFASAGECAAALAEVWRAPATRPGPGTALPDVFGATSVASPSAVAEAPSLQATTGSSLAIGQTKRSLDLAPKRNPLPLVLTGVAVAGIAAGVALLSLRRAPPEAATVRSDRPASMGAAAAPVTAAAGPGSAQLATTAPPAASVAPLPPLASAAVAPAATPPLVAAKPRARAAPPPATPVVTARPQAAKKPSDLYSDR